MSQQVAGFVGVGVSSGTFQQVVKKFSLIPALDSELNLSDPTSPGYVFNGAYVPVSCRLVQEVLAGRTNSVQMQEALKLLPGETVVESKAGDAAKVRGSRHMIMMLSGFG